MSVLHLKLNDPKTASKTYWEILKIFVNETKIPLTPPLLVGNQLVIDFLVKANLFKDYIRQQCTAVESASSIPPNTTFATVQKLSTFELCTDDINKIIKSLDYVLLQSENFCKFSLEIVLKMNVSLKNGRKPTLYLLIKK